MTNTMPRNVSGIEIIHIGAFRNTMLKIVIRSIPIKASKINTTAEGMVSLLNFYIRLLKLITTGTMIMTRMAKNRSMVGIMSLEFAASESRFAV